MFFDEFKKIISYDVDLFPSIIHYRCIFLYNQMQNVRKHDIHFLLMNQMFCSVEILTLNTQTFPR